MSKPKGFKLECSHVVYFNQPYPHLGDTLYCRECRGPREVGPADAAIARIYEDDFWSEPSSSGFVGGCTAQGCLYTSPHFRNWFKLRDHMHSHYMNEHTSHGSPLKQLLDSVKGQINDEPPF